MAKEGNVSWDDKTVTGGRSTIFALEKDQTARICVLTSQAVMALDHFSKKARKHARCIKSVGACPGCDSLGDPKERFGTKILVYGTNNSGELAAPVKVSVQGWIFGSDKFIDLRQLQKEWGALNKLDLMVSCTDKTFQTFKFVPARECFWRKSEKFMAHVKDLFAKTKIDLDAILGRQLSPEETAERLGLDYTSTRDTDAGFVGFDDSDAPVPDPVPAPVPAPAPDPAPAPAPAPAPDPFGLDDGLASIPVDASFEGEDTLSDIDAALEEFI